MMQNSWKEKKARRDTELTSLNLGARQEHPELRQVIFISKECLSNKHQNGDTLRTKEGVSRAMNLHSGRPHLLSSQGKSMRPILKNT